MARENAMMEATINVAEETVTFRRTKTGETLIIRAKDAHPDMRQYAMLHGLKQRGADNGAVERKTKDGRIRTADEQEALRWENVKIMVEHINSGTPRWNIREPGTGGAKKPAIDVDLVIRAAVAVKGGTVSYADMRAYLQRRATTAGCELDAIAASLANDPKVAAAIAEIRRAEADTSLIDGWEEDIAAEDGDGDETAAE